MAANIWPPTGWKILYEDTDTVLGRPLGNGRAHLIIVEDMVDACGSEWVDPCPYYIELREVDMSVLTEKQLEDVRCSIGWSESVEDWEKTPDIWKALEIHRYGLSAPLGKDKAKVGYQAAVRRMAKLSLDIDDNPAVREHYMSLPVNAIGSTAGEFMRGDLDSAMKRWEDCDFEGECVATKLKEGAGLPTDTKVGHDKHLGRMVSRQVSQSNMSAECLMVQTWGVERCKNCEYRQTSECGGQEIRKTGKNNKGFKVPLASSRAEALIERDGV